MGCVWARPVASQQYLHDGCSKVLSLAPNTTVEYKVRERLWWAGAFLWVNRWHSCSRRRMPP